MKTPTLLIIVGISLILSACSPTNRIAKINMDDQGSVIKNIKVEYDNFKKTTNITAPNITKKKWGQVRRDQLFLRAFKNDKTKNILYQIYVADYYEGDWRFYNSAHDSNGNRLNLTKIDRKTISCTVDVCSHKEHIALNVTIKYLEANSNSGISFKVSGKAGEEVFFIPSAYIKAFLSVAK